VRGVRKAKEKEKGEKARSKKIVGRKAIRKEEDMRKRVNRAKVEGSSAGIVDRSIEAMNRVGRGLSYLPARLHRLAGRYDSSVSTQFPSPHTVEIVLNAASERKTGT
jgi:hypothetical protein